MAGARPRRKSVLLSSQCIASDHRWDQNTESVEGVSSADEEDFPEVSVMETPILAEGIQARAFASLDSVNLIDTFYHRPKLMQTVPWVLRGAFRSAIQEALQDILAGLVWNDVVKATRGWKLLLRLPRMIPRSKLEAKITSFQFFSMFVVGIAASCAESPHTDSSQEAWSQHDGEGKTSCAGFVPRADGANHLRRDGRLKVWPWPQATWQLFER